MREIKPDVLDVYLARINPDEPITPVYPDERNAEIKYCKNIKLKICKYADWRLLSTAIDNSFGLDFNTLSFSKTKNGKWISDKVFFSLSHSGDFVAVAVSNMPVGIDIESESDFLLHWEEKPEKLLSLAKKVYTKRELRDDEVTNKNYLKKWVLKEAIFKRDGKGNYYPQRIDSRDENSEVFVLDSGSLPLVAISSEHLHRVKFYLSESGKLKTITP